MFGFYAAFTIAPFDDRAAQQFDELRSARIRMRTMDLKIAALARVHDTLLLSANLRDCELILGLRLENWLE